MRSRWTSSTSSPVRALWPYVLELRITLIGISPPISRLIRVPVNYVFFALHSAIQDTMGWGGQCSYRFEKFSRRPEKAAILLPLFNEVPSYEHDWRVRCYLVNDGDTAIYSVHRCDSQWEFQVVLEKITTSVECVCHPQCTDGEGSSPPEGIGFQEFQHHMNVAADPTNPHTQDSIGFLVSMGYSDHFNPQSVVFKDPKERFRLEYGQ